MNAADLPLVSRSPSAWRGRSTVSRAGVVERRPALFARIGREIADHPAETTALVAMAVALSRLLPRRRGASSSRRRLLPLSIMAALCLIGLSACVSKVIAVEPALESYGRTYPENFAAAGRKIALEQCSACHAIDEHSRSPNANAPPMNTLLSRYDADRLADDLIAGAWVGHDEMPRFDFNVIAADSLIAYLEAIDKNRSDR